MCGGQLYTETSECLPEEKELKFATRRFQMEDLASSSRSASMTSSSDSDTSSMSLSIGAGSTACMMAS